MSERVFTISVEADYDLSVSEIWPDGDAPDDPTAEDVAAVMESCGTKRRVLHDWNIDDHNVTVDGRVKVWG